MSDLKREDVARVLAETWREQAIRGADSLLPRIIAMRLGLSPEFDAALAEMEKEDRRG